MKSLELKIITTSPFRISDDITLKFQHKGRGKRRNPELEPFHTHILQGVEVKIVKNEDSR